MRTAWWLALRYFGNWRQLLSLSTGLSVVGMAIGVASLVVSMAVFSGYVSTLEKTVQDAFGHLIVIKRASESKAHPLETLRAELADAVAETPFVSSDAMIAHQGKVSGVLLEGIDPQTVSRVLNLRDRIVEGRLDLASAPNEAPKVVIGQGIARKFNLRPGDEVRVVVPLSTEYQANGFKPKLGRFKVTGVISYGRYDFDARYIMTSLIEAQRFLELGDRITGYRVRLRDPYLARGVSMAIAGRHAAEFWARDWLDVNRNLFEAARLEKAVLFFVLMILVVAAAFNIANMLFISVVQRFRDISVLKTLGASNRLIATLFSVQGVMVGAVGATLGIAIGLSLCAFLGWAQSRWQLIPPEVYKLDHIDLEIRGADLLLILGVSLVVCYIATLVPSRRGARISPVEGLRYE